jgi:hypothetical protein
MLRLGLRKSQPAEKAGAGRLLTENELKIEYFRKMILDHLSELEKQEEKALNKAFAVIEIAKGGFPVGTIRTWNGVKHVKVAPGKWRPKYDSQTRGAKMAISAIKKRIAAAKDEHEMMQICLANRDRFSDKDGHPLPFMQELSKYIDEQKTIQKKPAQPAPVAKPAKVNPKDITVGSIVTYPSRSGEGNEKGKVLAIYDGGEIRTDTDGVISISEISNVEKNEKSPDQDETQDKPENQKKEAAKQFTIQELNDGWKDGIFTIQEVADNLEDGDVFQGWAANIWREAAALVKEYQAEKISGKEFKERKTKLFSDENKTEGTLEPSGSGDSFAEIQAKYQSAKSIEGDDDELQVGKETMPGKWKLVEADTPTASHDETSFHKTPGFPTNADGSTINDRDYGHDRAAQDAVMDIGSDFDGRALRVDNPVIITTDGIVISGNNRTMSSKIAAKKGTDTKYMEALKKRAKKFGFTAGQVGEFKNPRVVFEVKQEGSYTTEQFAKFNESGKKEMGPTEKAVKVSKMIKPETVGAVAQKIGEFETLGELYADRNAVQHIFNAFKNSGLVGEFEAGKYIENGSITEDGKTFIETALLGSVMNENNIRGFNRPGCKSIRGMLVRAITPLIENKSMGGYSIARELNEAADIAMQVAINKDKFKSVEEFSKQPSMFEKIDPVSIELAKKMEGTQKAFAEFMQKMNGSLKYAANGEADIFLGDIESKEDILGRFLPVKKAVSEVLDSIKGLFDGRGLWRE